MKKLNKILIQSAIVMVVLLISFAPIVKNLTIGQLYAGWLSMTFKTKIGVESALAKTPIDHLVVAQPISDTIIYLPFVMNKSDRYTGKITDNGVPVANQTVELMYDDGSGWSSIDSQITNLAGSYSFTNLPVPTAGRRFYVVWLNNFHNPNYLAGYYCDTIDLYNIINSPLSCDINIHNIALLSPEDDASVNLPSTFEWMPRPTTSDSYEFDIEDLADQDPWWWTAPPLGYTNTYELTSLPEGFQEGQVYGWYMGVFGTNGLGFSYNYKNVTFLSSGELVIGPETPIDKTWLLERKDRELATPAKE
jgi:hypothetical protein